MTDKLQEIKDTISKARNQFDEFGDVNYSKQDELILWLFDHGRIDWLIEQAERVQELEKEKFIHFTGLKDKYGKEIDNGAVIKRYKDSIVLGTKTKVEFYQKIVYVEKYAQYLLEDKNGVQEHASWASTGEVVGNIHEDKNWMEWEKKGV